ncbi:MAG: VanZ family protein [Deltaproteobacteria bacterium]|nr:MAG: VanZ family protein [Deltaproteobacteria bacterium]
MGINSDAIYHLSLLFLVSMIFIPLKRTLLIALIFVIPAFTEIVQFFVPGRVPDFMDAFHGYLGILLAYCLIQLWRELLPPLKKFRLNLQRQ